MADVPVGSLDPDKDYLFSIVLKDGRRFNLPKQTEAELHRWLSRVPISLVTSYQLAPILFQPEDIQAIELQD